MGKDDDVTFFDEVLKGIGGHFTKNGLERSLADIDGCAVNLIGLRLLKLMFMVINILNFFIF
jgi:hypothetical protein